jgi:hypothetical protein
MAETAEVRLRVAPSLQMAPARTFSERQRQLEAELEERQQQQQQQQQAGAHLDQRLLAQAMERLGIDRSITPGDLLSWTEEQRKRFVDSFPLEKLADTVRVMRQLGWASPETTVTFRNLFWKRGGQVLVNGISGYVKVSAFVALRGGASSRRAAAARNGGGHRGRHGHAAVSRALRPRLRRSRERRDHGQRTAAV